MPFVIVSSAYASLKATISTVTNDKSIAYDDVYDTGKDIGQRGDLDALASCLCCGNRERASMSEVQEKEWEDRVKGLLKAELKRKGVTYAQLVGLLADQGRYGL